jgi:SAM-dependent MidA family methyltransferase
LNEVSQKIAKEIALKGVIPFARFMELSLYCPIYGYYERERDTIGVRGDYYTSVSVGPLFGELLAFEFAEWLVNWALKPVPFRLKIVEAGAHDGRLAEDILSWLTTHGRELLERLEYCIVEPSSARQQWQQRTLQSFGDRVHWVGNIQSLGPTSCSSGIQGIIFSNEFLDALPVHRFGWDAEKRNWFEWGVIGEADHFTWARMECGCDVVKKLWNRLKLACLKPNAQHDQDPAALAELAQVDFPAEVLAALPDGFTVELCPSAEQWWRDAAAALEWGALVAIDYGFSSQEWLSPERRNGTLRAYRAHRLIGDLLASPGEQDLTADVDFTAIRSAGEAAGLKTELFDSQAQFLVRAFARLCEQPGLPDSKGGRKRQFQTLTHPEHLGRPFRVLVQSRLGGRRL